MIARLFIDGEQRAEMKVPPSGITLELFGVEFPPGLHHIVVTVGT